MRFISINLALKRLLLIIIILQNIFLNCALGNNNPVEITLIHFSDLHSAFEPIQDKSGNYLGGIARIKGYLEELEKNGNNLLILCSGDIIQGTIGYRILNNLPEVDVLNFLNVAAMTLGNHEFDGGLDLIQNGFLNAKFDLLSANIEFPENYKFKEQIKKFVIKELKINNQVIKIAILGLTDDLMKEEVPISKLQGITIHDAVLTLRRLLPQILEKKPDVIILLSHLGWKKEQEISMLFPEIHGILGGHTHLFIDPPIIKSTKYGHQFLSQPGEYGKSITRYDLIVYPNNNQTKDTNLPIDNNYSLAKVFVKNAKLIYIDSSIQESQNAKNLLEKIKSNWEKKTSEVIGETKVFLDGERKNVRSKDTNLGNIIADAIIEALPSDASFINGGGIRRSIPVGKITLSDCYTCLPFENNLVRLHIYGSDLIKAFEQMLDGLKVSPSFGGYLHVSNNMRVICGDDGKFNITINNTQVDPSKLYTITTVDYLADGGNGLTALLNAFKRETSSLLAAEALISYIRKYKIIDQQVQIRTTIPAKFYYNYNNTSDFYNNVEKIIINSSFQTNFVNKYVWNIFRILSQYLFILFKLEKS